MKRKNRGLWIALLAAGVVAAMIGWLVWKAPSDPVIPPSEVDPDLEI